MNQKLKIRIEIIPEDKSLPISVRTFYNDPPGVEKAKEYVEHYKTPIRRGFFDRMVVCKGEPDDYA